MPYYLYPEVFMFYEKKVKYLDYLVGGEKKRGAGFVKTEVRDRDLRMSVKINGIYTAKPLETDIVAKGAGKSAVLRRIRLNNGSGDSGEIRLNAAHMGGNLSYGELEQLVIPLSEKCEIVCVWKERTDHGAEEKNQRQKIMIREPAVHKQKEMEREADLYEEKAYPGGKGENAEESEADGAVSREMLYDERTAHDGEMGYVGQSSINEKRESGREKAMTEETGDAGEKRYGAGMSYDRETEDAGEDRYDEQRKLHGEEREQAAAEHNKAEKERSESGRIEGYDRNERLPCEDKWRQLASIYPHMDIATQISDCITIKPADFVIFPTKYYSMVTNSFLLHGYHNYGHLVLARVEKRGEIRYYIGVPGIFFDRERQVALMFGFESFECGKDFAESGDYGYYMIRVEL